MKDSGSYRHWITWFLIWTWPYLPFQCCGWALMDFIVIPLRNCHFHSYLYWFKGFLGYHSCFLSTGPNLISFVFFFVTVSSSIDSEISSIGKGLELWWLVSWLLFIIFYNYYIRSQTILAAVNDSQITKQSIVERILKVTKKSGNRGRCRKLSLWKRDILSTEN